MLHFWVVQFIVSYSCITRICWNFRIMDIPFVQICWLFHLANKSATNISHTNIMYLEASTSIDISTFWRKMWGLGCGSWNRPSMFSCQTLKTSAYVTNTKQWLEHHHRPYLKLIILDFRLILYSYIMIYKAAIADRTFTTCAA